MTIETRRKIAKIHYANGDYDHVHVKEFWNELSIPVVEPPKPKKKKRRSRE